MADFEVSLQAKLDESSLESIKKEIELLQAKLKVQAEIDPKAISSIESQIKALEKAAAKIQIDIDTSKLKSSMSSVASDTGKMGDQAGKQFGSRLSSSLQSDLKSVKKDIASALSSFDEQKITAPAIREKYGLNLPSVEPSVLENIRKATSELRKYEKEIFNATSADVSTEAWSKVADKIKEIRELISANGQSKIDRGQYAASEQIADYFSGKTIYAGPKADVLANTGMTIQELSQQFRGLGVTFKSTEKDAVKLDTVIGELTQIDPSLQGVDNYSDMLAKIVEHLKIAKSLNGQMGFQDLNDRELVTYLNSYANALEDTERKINVFRSEQTEIEQQLAQQSSSSTDTIVQDEQRKQEAIQQTAEASQKAADATQKAADATQKAADTISKAQDVAANTSSASAGKTPVPSAGTLSNPVVANFKDSLKNIGFDESKINGVIAEIEQYVDKIKSLRESVSTVNGKNGEQQILSVEVSGIDKYGQAVKMTQQWDVANDELIKSLNGVSAAQDKAASGVSSFENRKKKEVTNLTNQINQASRSALDPNSSRPIADESHIQAVVDAYDKVMEAIERVKNANSETFTDEQNNVRTMISDFKSLVSELQRAENVATKMKSVDLESGLNIALNDLDKFIADASGFKSLEGTVKSLETAFGNITDVASLNEFNNQLRVARSELAKTKSEDSTDEILKIYQQMADLEVKKADLKTDTTQDVQAIKDVERELENLKAKYQEVYESARKTDTFDPITIATRESQIDIDTGRRIDNVTAINQTKAAYQELLDIANQVSKTEVDLAKINPNTNPTNFESLTAKLEEFKTKYDEVYGSLLSKGLDLDTSQFVALTKIFEKAEQEISNLRNNLKDKMQIELDTGKMESSLENAERNASKLGNEYDDLKGKVAELRDAFNTMSDTSKTDDERIAAYQQLIAILPQVDSELNNIARTYNLTAQEQNTLTRSQTLSNNIQTWMDENRKAAERYGEALKNLQTQLNGNVDQKVEQQSRLSFNSIKAESRMLGLVDNNSIKSLKNTALYMAGFGSAFQAINTTVRYIKEAVSFARELDSALTNINYTMDVTASQLEAVGSKSIEMAKDLHTSSENVLQAVTLYANAKETTDSILEKAQPAIMLSNVTGFSGEESAKYLQTIMNQFDLTQDDLMNISDTIQAVSQNIAHDFSKTIAA